MCPMEFSADKHLTRIDQSIGELCRLDHRTSSPAHIAHQYIGTVVHNTLALLTAPANSLDHGIRHATFSESKNWLSLMQAVHRSFFSSIQLATERGLAALCEERSIDVQSSAARSFNRELTTLLAMFEDEDTAKQVRRLANSVPRFRPTFDDHLNAVMKGSTLSRETKRNWRSFFQALSIVRNKSSHSDPTLSSTEAQKLVDGGCGVMVSDDGRLHVNPRMYKQVVCGVLDFFDLLTETSAKPI